MLQLKGSDKKLLMETSLVSVRTRTLASSSATFPVTVFMYIIKMNSNLKAGYHGEILIVFSETSVSISMHKTELAAK